MTLSGILIGLLIVALIVVGPIFTILALNTLFPVLAIPFTFQTWLAAVWIGLLVGTKSSSSKS